MRKYLTATFVLGLVLIRITALQAGEDDHGWYISGKIGYISGQNYEINIPSNRIPRAGIEVARGRPSFVSIALGQKWRNVRVEGELIRQVHFTDEFRYTHYTGSNLDDVNSGIEQNYGTIRLRGFMTNLWYDFDTKMKWTPYIGVGVGLIDVKYEYTFDASLQHSELYDDGPEKVSKDLVLGFQIGVGFSYEMNKSTILELSYRFLNSSGFDLYSPDRTIKEGGRLEFNGVRSHNVALGVRIKLY